MRIQARHYATREPLDWTIDSGRIVSVRPAEQPLVEDWFLAPSLFDLQINGCLGYSFNSPKLTDDQIYVAASVCRQHGVGGFLATVITQSFEAIRHGLMMLARARERDAMVARTIAGYHLEGPYLSADDGPRGAHPRAHIRPPDWDEFRCWQDAALGKIRLVTLAPEVDGALPFIEKLAKSGVVVAIGHTAAAPERVRDAVAAGARLSTHLGNGAHATLPRHPNYIWEQLANDHLWASIIPDGHHLPASVVKSIVRVKGPGRTIITCDASSVAGLAPGRYSQWGTELEVAEGGKVVVPGTPFLAGSGMFTSECLGPAVRMTELGWGAVIDMAAARPRELLSLPAVSLEVGSTGPWMMYRLRQGEVDRPRLID
jgi:N-acetylglucosamine-6-phosphate deacetylase